MKIQATIIFWIIWTIWVIWFISHNFNFKLAYDVWRGKRKFFYIKGKCHLDEDTGAYEFGDANGFREPYRTYLLNHTIEFECMVEQLEIESDSCLFDKYFWLSPVDYKGKRDYLFQNKARTTFSTFHIHKDLVTEMRPVKFSFRFFFESTKSQLKKLQKSKTDFD